MSLRDLKALGFQYTSFALNFFSHGDFKRRMNGVLLYFVEEKATTQQKLQCYIPFISSLVEDI